MEHDNRNTRNNSVCGRVPMARRELPDRRHTWTQSAVLGNTKVHLGFGEYEDGSLGEVWIDVSRAGSAARALFGTVAIFVSMSLQYGVPVKSIVSSLRAVDFEPNGVPEGAGLEQLGSVSSVLDLVGRMIEARYCPADGGETKVA